MGGLSHRKSTDTAMSQRSNASTAAAAAAGARGRRYTSGFGGDVPGIEISRIDTLDFDDGSLLATCSGKHGYGGLTGSKRYIFINR